MLVKFPCDLVFNIFVRLLSLSNYSLLLICNVILFLS